MVGCAVCVWGSRDDSSDGTEPDGGKRDREIRVAPIGCGVGEVARRPVVLDERLDVDEATRGPGQPKG